MNNLLEFNVSLYEKPPQGIEHIVFQIHSATERLKLYEFFRTHESPTIAELKTELNSPLKLLLETNPPEIMDIRKMDFIGHWTLRVAYSSKYFQFFVKNELTWFEMRFSCMSQQERWEFIKRNKIELAEPSDEEVSKFQLEGKCFKVEWTRAPTLVEQRSCPLGGGYIFIPEKDLVFVLLERLRKHLKRAEMHVQRMLPMCCDQMKLILSSLELIKPYKYFGGKTIHLEELESRVKHFPLCMKLQHETLRKNHHLKHFSRFQYGLFLKGIGLPLEESLRMWQEEFMNNDGMTEKKFLSKYSYFFKHIYGTVGAKIDYQPQNCDKILTEDPQQGGVNGCPYKNWDERSLSKRLKQDDVRPNHVEKILDLKRENKFREACTKCLKFLHNCEVDEIIAHPVTYYEKSCAGVDIEDLFASDSE